MHDGVIYALKDLPSSEVNLASGKARREIDAYALANIVDNWHKIGHIDSCAIERVQAIGKRRPTPGQEEEKGDGAVGAFAFGECAGTIRGVISSFFIPIARPTPQQWRRDLCIERAAKGDKGPVVARATALWPNQSNIWKAKTHADRAEAALIALWMQQMRRA